MPWRVLVHALQATSDVAQLRSLISKRLMDAPRIVAGQRHLDDMLITLWKAGYLELEPPPDLDETGKVAEPSPSDKANVPAQDDLTSSQSSPTLFGQSLGQSRGSKETPAPARKSTTDNAEGANADDASDARPPLPGRDAMPDRPIGTVGSVSRNQPAVRGLSCRPPGHCQRIGNPSNHRECIRAFRTGRTIAAGATTRQIAPRSTSQ